MTHPTSKGGEDNASRCFEISLDGSGLLLRAVIITAL